MELLVFFACKMQDAIAFAFLKAFSKKNTAETVLTTARAAAGGIDKANKERVYYCCEEKVSSAFAFVFLRKKYKKILYHF
jgi:hypothetical protein